jgi:hypothetical protein
MAFYKSALEQIGLFDPVFRKAGDDVDICWRLQDAQLRIGFSPAAFVWHYRRSTVQAYLKQQVGYGEAEALLIAKHPEHYNAVGGGLWRGRIYASSFAGLLLRGPAIYHGVFGSAYFQRLYAANPMPPFLYCTTLGYHAFVNLSLIGLALNFDVFIPLALASLALSAGTCGLAAGQARLPARKRRFWSRPLVALLFFLQPVVRSWARLKWRRPKKYDAPADTESVPTTEPPSTFAYWSETTFDRLHLLRDVLARLDSDRWPVRTDSGWETHDLEVLASPWIRLRFASATEELDLGRRQLRCRLTAQWSFLARAALVLMVIAVVLLISLFARELPWAWFAPLLPAVLIWYFQDESSMHKSNLAQVIGDVFKAHKLVRIEA